MLDRSLLRVPEREYWTKSQVHGRKPEETPKLSYVLSLTPHSHGIDTMDDFCRSLEVDRILQDALEVQSRPSLNSTGRYTRPAPINNCGVMSIRGHERKKELL